MKTATSKFPLNTFSDQIIICQISFGNLWCQTNLFLNEKVNIWTQWGYFPFLFHFSVEMKQPRNLQQKTGERWKIIKPIILKRNFLEVTGNLYWGLYIYSCSLDVSAIKNALLKHFQIYSRIPIVGTVQVFSLEIYPQFHFLGFFLLGTPESTLWECFLFFFFYRNVSYSLCFYLFLQKLRQPVLFSSSWLLLIVIYKFNNRRSCGYCFRHFGKFLCERPQWSSL